MRGGWWLALALALPSCNQSSTSQDQVTVATFGPVTPLTAVEVGVIVEQAALAIDAPNLTVAVVDRVGNILAVWIRNAATSAADQNIAVTIARTAAFLSHSQAPLTSRTGEFITTFHFPATFGAVQAPAFPTLAGRRQTTGVENTAQGPLWQLDNTNRGAKFCEGAELGCYNAGKSVPLPKTIAGTVPSPGLTMLPGGVPLYKGGRLVGGIGCYGSTPEACEYAAIQGRVGFDFPSAVPPEGAVYLVGVLLPNVEQVSLPAGLAGGTFVGTFTVAATAGAADPDGYLIGPRADPLGNFTSAQVDSIVQNCINRANETRAAIRLPLGTASVMSIAVTNLEGLVLALYRMTDGTIFSLDVAVTKARTVTYFSSASLDPLDQVAGVPVGTAFTTRTLGFLTQPFFPPGIDFAGQQGPIFSLVAFQQDPANFDNMGHAPAAASPYQSGLILFPGAAPLYSAAGALIGGLGVSGDGVEQDDYVTAAGAGGFEPAASIKADSFSFNGVPLPYFKFPQNPGPGN